MVDSRFAAMKRGLTAATLGSPPIDFLGKKLGFVVLARANEVFNLPAAVWRRASKRSKRSRIKSSA